MDLYKLPYRVHPSSHELSHTGLDFLNGQSVKNEKAGQYPRIFVLSSRFLPQLPVDILDTVVRY